MDNLFLFLDMFIFAVFLLFVDSILGRLDFAPIDALFQHDSGCLNGCERLEDAHADPEEQNHEEDAEEGVRVDPLANPHVGIVDGLGLCVCEQKSHHGHD